MNIVAVSSAEEAVADAGIVIAAVKSSTPVLFGGWLKPGVHVNSVGTARRDQRELDVDVFARAARIVVDTRSGVFEEAGDAYAARESVMPDRVSELCELVGGISQGRQDDREIKRINLARPERGMSRRVSHAGTPMTLLSPGPIYSRGLGP
jgi:ornithine cyclodeaminase/alanine dehydrogenase-like protein (mu-crystallin family)